MHLSDIIRGLFAAVFGDRKGHIIILSVKITKKRFSVENDILEGGPRNQWAQTVTQTLVKKYPQGVNVGNNTIKINKISRNELLNSEYRQGLARKSDTQTYSDKLRSLDNTDEILKASRDYVNEAPKHARKDNIVDFGRGKVLMRIGKNDYSAEVLVDNTSGNNQLLYDVINLTPTTIKERTSNSPLRPIAFPLKARSKCLVRTIIV